jgi:hypothetical protein
MGRTNVTGFPVLSIALKFLAGRAIHKKHPNGHARSVPPRARSSIYHKRETPIRIRIITILPTLHLSISASAPLKASEKSQETNAPITGMVCEVSKTPKRTPLCNIDNNNKTLYIRSASTISPTYTSLSSIPQRHPLNPIDQRPPTISLQLSVLHPLLRPLLMRPRNPPDHALEKQDLVAHAFADEDAARVLVDDRLFVLLVRSQ